MDFKCMSFGLGFTRSISGAGQMNIEYRTGNIEPTFSRGQACPCWSRGLSIIVQYSLFVILFFCVATARGQRNTNQPHIGYLYPAGAQQGTVVRITAGGQALRNSTDVYVSGKGVHAKVIKYCRAFRNLQSEQRKWLQARLKELRTDPRRRNAPRQRPNPKRSQPRKAPRRRPSPK